MRAFALSLLLAAPAAADTISLDFAEEALGDHGNSFLSAECGCVVLSELSGTESLYLYEFDPGVHTLVAGGQGGDLRLEFVDLNVTGLAITFGGDRLPDEEDTQVKPAHLTGYVGDTLVAEAFVDSNRNMLVDQTITITSETPLTSAIFSFVQLGPHQPDSPFIGAITLTLVSVPEPAAALLLLALAATISRRRAHSDLHARNRAA